KKDQVNDQDDHRNEFEEEGAALIELVDHEPVKLFGGAQFLRNQVFVVRNSHFGCRQLVQTGGKHVRQELDRVVGVLGQLGHIQEDGMKFARVPGHTTAVPHS